MGNQKVTYTDSQKQEEKENKKKYNVLACNCCHATSLPLIKATDSYYCKFCFDKLHKEKFKKKGRK